MCAVSAARAMCYLLLLLLLSRFSRVCCNGRAKAQAAASAAERSHPTSKVRGRNREDPMPEGRRPRGVTPRPRSGAAAKSTRLRWRRNGPEELPHVQGAVATWAQEVLEELFHVQGQEGRLHQLDISGLNTTEPWSTF